MDDDDDDIVIVIIIITIIIMLNCFNNNDNFNNKKNECCTCHQLPPGVGPHGRIQGGIPCPQGGENLWLSFILKGKGWGSSDFYNIIDSNPSLSRNY